MEICSTVCTFENKWERMVAGLGRELMFSSFQGPSPSERRRDATIWEFHLALRKSEPEAAPPAPPVVSLTLQIALQELLPKFSVKTR